jgi:hypothetical protein
VSLVEAAASSRGPVWRAASTSQGYGSICASRSGSGQAGSRSPFACAGHAAAVLNSGRPERGLGPSGSADEWVPAQLRFPVTITARILLRSGTDVEVLSLAEVRDDLRTTAESIAATYVEK